MSIQDLGSIGELIAAVATVATLAYLAVQMGQNTRALRSSTFQQISTDMSQTAEAIAMSPDLAGIVAKAREGLAALSIEERTRFSFLMLMTFRRLESVFVQRELGSIDASLTIGFERSAISVLAGGGAAEWWEATRVAFSTEFVALVDGVLAEGATSIHEGFKPD
jgi:hypothetical protein